MDWLGRVVDSNIEFQFNYLLENYADGLEWWMYGEYRSPSHRNSGGYYRGKSMYYLTYSEKKRLVEFKDTLISICEDERLYRTCEKVFKDHFYGVCVILVKYLKLIVASDNGSFDKAMHDKIGQFLKKPYSYHFRSSTNYDQVKIEYLCEFHTYSSMDGYGFILASDVLKNYHNIMAKHLEEIKIADQKIREMYRNEKALEEFKSKILLDKIRSQYYQDFLKSKEKELTDKVFCVKHLDELDQFIHIILEQKCKELQKKYGYRSIETFKNINDLGSSNSDLYTIITYERDIAEISRRSRQEQDQMIEDQRLARIRKYFEGYNEAIRKEKIRKKEAKQRDVDTLNSCISSWDKHSNYGFPYFSMFYYYPTSVDAVTNKDWEIRNLIWGFKADPSRTTKMSKSEADFDVRMHLEKIINHFFGNNKKLLTFVCVPASTKKTTELRYKAFSQDICSELNMNNAYGYIEVYHDKTPKHEGGESEQVLSIDSAFFKDKYVILFDDILTSGKSLAKMKERLESYGATVIGCITIGITKHQHIYTKQPIDTI